MIPSCCRGFSRSNETSRSLPDTCHFEVKKKEKINNSAVEAGGHLLYNKFFFFYERSISNAILDHLEA